MSTLQDRLDRIKDGFLAHAATEAGQIIARATKELQNSGIMDRLPKVGSMLPAFELPDTEGKIITSAELLRKGPLIISFYRGVWWPFCNAELDALQQHYDEIRDLGAELVVISPQNPDKSAEIKERHHLEFPVLCDAGNSYAKQYSIVFTLSDDMQHLYQGYDILLPEYNGDDSWELPMPTRIVVDGDGIIRDIEADPDYTHRPDPEATVEVLEEKIQATSKRLLHRLRTELKAERRRSEELILNILPAPIAAELKREGRVRPVHVDTATVLFTDFEGFTAAAAQMSARNIVDKLNECFTAFDEIVEKHGLEKLKTIGDAYMAAGGVLGDGEDHTARMVRAAIEMRDWIMRWSGSCEVCGEKGWGVRIGIHRGPLVAGVIGTKKFSFDVWGDTVNLAARLETAGETGRINVSKEVVDSLGEEFDVEERGIITAKNRGDIEMFFVGPRRSGGWVVPK